MISAIKKETILYTIIAAPAIGAASLLVFGLEILFPFGLGIGVCAALTGLHIIGTTIEKAANEGKSSAALIGFILRVVLYLAALSIAAITAPRAAYGAAIGLLLPHLMIYIKFALRPAIRRRLGKEPQVVYVTDSYTRQFIKKPWFVRYYNGRAYLTHRYFRKVKIKDS